MNLIVIFMLLVPLVAANPRIKRAVPEDKDLSMTELITKYGYPNEKHIVQTADGYLLTLYRIPYGLKCGQNETKRASVLIQHGILSSSVDFIIPGPEWGTGYILADNCYDVWLGNNRGNTESRAHITLDPDHDEDAFWNFSWHEMGQYDDPAMVDYILNVTGEPSLMYVGHSQGTTQFFVFASLHPEYHSKIRAMFALAPIAWMDNVDSLLLELISEFSGSLDWLAGMIGLNEFAPSDGFINLIGRAFCRDTVIPGTEYLCENVLFLMTGVDWAQTNETLLPILMGHSPAGCATKQLIHFSQLIKHRGHFRMFDYGKKENIKLYGVDPPPDYDLSQVNIPIALHYGDNDVLATVKDVQKLYDALPHVIGQFRVPFDSWNHLDFMWAKDINPLMHKTLLGLMERY